MTLFAPRPCMFEAASCARAALATTAAAACALGVATPPSPGRLPATGVDPGRVRPAASGAAPGPASRRTPSRTPGSGRSRRPPVPTLVEKLGDSDVRPLQKAEARGDETVTVLLAATPGDTDQVTATVQGPAAAWAGARRTSGTSGPRCRSTRCATSPRWATSGPSTSTAATGSPTRRRRSAGAAGASRRRRRGTRPDTPADNPYLPVGETGATDFVDAPPHLGRTRRHRRHPGQRCRPRPPRAADAPPTASRRWPAGSPPPIRPSTATSPGVR